MSKSTLNQNNTRSINIDDVYTEVDKEQMDRFIKYSMAADSQMSRRGHSVEQEQTERMNSREMSATPREYMMQFNMKTDTRLGASFKNQP